MDVVVFQVGNRRCALELEQVEEVIRLGPVTPVPSPARAVTGAINVRGQVVAVLDAWAMLGEPPAPRLTRGGVGLLAQAESCRVVLRVDRVEGVVPIGELGSAWPPAEGPVLLELPVLIRAVLQELQDAGRCRREPAPGRGQPPPQAGETDG